ncbi:MAG: aminodeoxychorismate/anthranilate synthase component II [Candidatus Omnitrophica bacterium]|nr:aminodeoxychorismate/anthranilate synthase component II [Candidatus Omnitrophota bacterium]
MVLIIDNYDSFTYNLVQYLGELGGDLQVYRNDRITSDEIRRLAPSRIVISPGPKWPRDAGISEDVIRQFAGKIPLLGVCLGHQCIGEVYGAKIALADRLMHGKTSLIYHNGKTIFKGIENPFSGTRYHSLLVSKAGLPNCLEITAETREGEIMGLKHKRFPVWGLQFHPESILTTEGKKILANFLNLK